MMHSDSRYVEKPCDHSPYQQFGRANAFIHYLLYPDIADNVHTGVLCAKCGAVIVCEESCSKKISRRFHLIYSALFFFSACIYLLKRETEQLQYVPALEILLCVAFVSPILIRRVVIAGILSTCRWIQLERNGRESADTQRTEVRTLYFSSLHVKVLTVLLIFKTIRLLHVLVIFTIMGLIEGVLRKSVKKISMSVMVLLCATLSIMLEEHIVGYHSNTMSECIILLLALWQGFINDFHLDWSV